MLKLEKCIILYFTQKKIQVYTNHMLIEQGQNGYRKVNSTFDKKTTWKTKVL